MSTETGLTTEGLREQVAEKLWNDEQLVPWSRVFGNPDWRHDLEVHFERVDELLAEISPVLEKLLAERDEARQALAAEIAAIAEERIATRRVDVLDLIHERDALKAELAETLKTATGLAEDRAEVLVELAEARAAIEQLGYERRLLGWARMTLDLVAAGGPERQEQARREAEDIAQRIVDEIGHPVTDEPAFGPGFRAAIERTREAMERYAAAGCTTVNLRQVTNLLSPTWPDGNYEAALDAPQRPEDTREETNDG